MPKKDFETPTPSIRTGVPSLTNVELGKTGRRVMVRANTNWAVGFVAKIYTTNQSALREQYINAISHGCLPVHAKGEETFVEINIDFSRRIITITDVNGTGIPVNTVEQIMAELGKTGNTDDTRPGQHGVGFYSFLIFSSFAKIETWSRATNEHIIWANRQGLEFVELLDEPKTLQTYGTRITLSIKTDIDMLDLVRSIEPNVEMFPVKTFVTYRNTPLKDDVIQVIADGTYEYGCKTYEDKMYETYREKNLIGVKKLETEFIDIYLGITGDAVSTWGRNTAYLCNVPINIPQLNEDTYSWSSMSKRPNYDIPIIVHIKNETKFKPLDNRDNLDLRNTTDLDEFTKIIKTEIKKYIGSITITSLGQIDKTIEAVYLKNSKVHDLFLDSRTQRISELVRMSIYDCVTPDSDNVRYRQNIELLELIRNRKKVLLINKIESSYKKTFVKDRGYTLLTYKSLARCLSQTTETKFLPDYCAPYKTINDLFADAHEYRKEHKIPLTMPNDTAEVVTRDDIIGFSFSRDNEDPSARWKVHGWNEIIKYGAENVVIMGPREKRAGLEKFFEKHLVMAKYPRTLDTIGYMNEFTAFPYHGGNKVVEAPLGIPTKRVYIFNSNKLTKKRQKILSDASHASPWGVNGDFTTYTENILVKYHNKTMSLKEVLGLEEFWPQYENGYLPTFQVEGFQFGQELSDSVIIPKDKFDLVIMYMWQLLGYSRWKTPQLADPREQSKVYSKTKFDISISRLTIKELKTYESMMEDLPIYKQRIALIVAEYFKASRWQEDRKLPLDKMAQLITHLRKTDYQDTDYVRFASDIRTVLHELSSQQLSYILHDKLSNDDKQKLFNTIIHGISKSIIEKIKNALKVIGVNQTYYDSKTRQISFETDDYDDIILKKITNSIRLNVDSYNSGKDPNNDDTLYNPLHFKVTISGKKLLVKVDMPNIEEDLYEN